MNNWTSSIKSLWKQLMLQTLCHFSFATDLMSGLDQAEKKELLHFSDNLDRQCNLIIVFASTKGALWGIEGHSNIHQGQQGHPAWAVDTRPCIRPLRHSEDLTHLLATISDSLSAVSLSTTTKFMHVNRKLQNLKTKMWVILKI